MKNQSRYKNDCYQYGLDIDFHGNICKKKNKTRWDFDQLNNERKQLDFFARKAFDPACSFSCIHFSEYDDGCQKENITFISQPHLFEPQQIPIPSKNVKQRTDVSKSYKHISTAKCARPRNSNTKFASSSAQNTTQAKKPLTPKKKFDIDSAIDGFVDDIEDYSIW